ncbi:MAG: hypothetical protein KGR98_10170, partial [Verrucomicrobia bacterium]|nr:hypothetical protein [Verrucomicrobiota bacterium]
MTLNVSLRVPDGIVLASDSLATLMSLVNQRINVSARLRALVCLFGLLALPPLAEGSDAPSVTFESFLTNPPAVERAEFDVIVGSRSLMQPHDVTRTFVEDGTNFLMSEVPMGAPLKPTSGYYFSGDFRGVRWHCGGWGNAGILMFCDPRLNTNPADPNNAFYWNETSAKAVEDNRGKINLMMHLGIQKMVSGSVEWKGGDTNFTAKFRGMGGSYVVTKKAGVPVATNYLAANGELRVHVTYGDGVPSMAQVEMAG